MNRSYRTDHIIDDDFDGEDKPKSNCAVFGIFNNPQAAVMTYYGLHSQQHRGQEASGICVSEKISIRKYVFNIHKGHGIALNVFSSKNVLTNVLREILPSAITGIQQPVHLTAGAISSHSK